MQFQYPFRLDLKDGQWRDLTADAIWVAPIMEVARACVVAVRELIRTGKADFTESEIQRFQFDYDGTRYQFDWQTK